MASIINRNPVPSSSDTAKNSDQVVVTATANGVVQLPLNNNKSERHVNTLPDLVICESDKSEESSCDTSTISDNASASSSSNTTCTSLTDQQKKNDKKSCLASIVSVDDDEDNTTKHHSRGEDEEDKETRQYKEALKRLTDAVMKSEESRNKIIRQYGWGLPKITIAAKLTEKKSTIKGTKKASIKIPAAATTSTIKKIKTINSTTPSLVKKAKKPVSLDSSIMLLGHGNVKSSPQEPQRQNLQQQQQQQQKQ